jgi:hypothetical protein
MSLVTAAEVGDLELVSENLQAGVDVDSMGEGTLLCLCILVEIDDKDGGEIDR